jgi:hypothetical protein
MSTTSQKNTGHTFCLKNILFVLFFGARAAQTTTQTTRWKKLNTKLS